MGYDVLVEGSGTLSVHRKIMLGLTFFVVAILAWICIDLVRQANKEFAYNVAGKALFWLIFAALEIKYGFYMNNYIRAVTILITITDTFFGFYWGLYFSSNVFDKVQHVIGSYACSLFTYILVIQLLPDNVRSLFKFALVFFIGLGLGSLYEISEFIGDIVTKPTIPSQPSLLDTDLDLITDALGAILAAIHVSSTNYFDIKMDKSEQ